MRNKWLPLIVVAIMLGFSALVYNQLPDEMPAHWNINGEVDRYSPKLTGVLMQPMIVLLLVAIRFGSRRIDPRRDAYHQFEGTFYLFTNGLALFFAMLHFLSLGTALGWQVSLVQFILPAIGLLFAVIGNEMRRIQPNWFLGIRTPWTLSDPQVWRATHVLGGRLFVGVGLLTILAGIVLPPAVGVIVLVVGILGITAWLYYYSYRQYQLRQAQ